MSLDAFLNFLKEQLPEGAHLNTTPLGEVEVKLLPQQLCAFIQKIKTNLDWRFEQLVDICGVDYPERSKRFDVVYHLLSFKKNTRLRLFVQVSENESVPSLVPLFPSACWWEREAWDMFGIQFSDTADLRRILTDYGFEGHPLRKDFPVYGYTQVRYDAVSGQVVNEPVKLAQDMRSFEFESPWEGVARLFETPVKHRNEGYTDESV